MIHRRKGRKLKRTASHRDALMSNLSASLILHKRIATTEAKAKELRMYIEPLVSKARKALQFKDSAPEKSVHLRREARKFLENKDALNILFNEISVKVGDRPGGFTRVLKTGTRFGDGARTAIIEFVDYNYVQQKQEKQKEREKESGDGTEKTGSKSILKKKAKSTDSKTEGKKEKKPSKEKSGKAKA
jgi:large subunit ribosomal protein L17